jgi:hypothetical protein
VTIATILLLVMLLWLSCVIFLAIFTFWPKKR